MTPHRTGPTEAHAVILAAGQASRFGSAKLAQPWGDTTVLGAVLSTLAQAGVASRYVVLGHGPEALADQARATGAQVARNPSPDDGMLSSVIIGLEALPTDARPVLIHPADIPGVRPETIGELLTHGATGHQMVICRHAGRRGHPVLLGAALRSLVPSLDPSVGLRGLRLLEQTEVVELDVDDAFVVVDIDTPEEYREALRAWNHTQHFRNNLSQIQPKGSVGMDDVDIGPGR